MDSNERIESALTYFKGVILASALLTHISSVEDAMARMNAFLMGVEATLSKEENAVFTAQAIELMAKLNVRKDTIGK